MPYPDTVTNTYNAHNRLHTSTDGIGHVTATIVYDGNDNPTGVTVAFPCGQHDLYTAFITRDTYLE